MLQHGIASDGSDSGEKWSCHDNSPRAAVEISYPESLAPDDLPGGH
jgi:hypothetical protein